ncbi:GT-D fold domain-containing glycosyltransferase [Paenibacillus alginolyticus]|uniref:GT-D fold domain-containing glycosyltransferase n=1 Tax=Paenibacillus alginolyticus TaxID=59839 RepID=UPI0004088E71|nr:GT-D fold domain-containing glycosyltransferase [Paenibacillus alginolyticus]MCY9668267.1 GT-D fold domain-containing glycosyltransferase [Paenibacillus alginolyticus]
MSFIELNTNQLMDKILHSLDNQLPLSVISVGVTETHVLAQYAVFSEDQFMNDPETHVANNSMVKRGHTHRGIRFPNIEARNEALEAVKNADIIGICIKVSKAGELTRKVFDVYGVTPKYVFEAYTRRVIMISQQLKFHQMLRNKNIIIICSYADDVRYALDNGLKGQLEFEITGTIMIEQYEDIPRVKQEITEYEFDLCLLAAGINAVILAPYIANELGKVAFDIGQGMETFITGEIEGEDWLSGQIELDRLLEM